MARMNNTVTLGATDETKQPGPARYNQQSLIFLNVDEGEEDREVTLEEFKQFVAEKPEWLYEKFLDMANWYHLSTEDQEG